MLGLVNRILGSVYPGLGSGLLLAELSATKLNCVTAAQARKENFRQGRGYSTFTAL